MGDARRFGYQVTFPPHISLLLGYCEKEKSITLLTLRFFALPLAHTKTNLLMETPMNPIVAQFMAQAKAKAEAKAVQLAALELSVWDNKHESELKQWFGYTDKSLKARKNELTKTAKAN